MEKYCHSQSFSILAFVMNQVKSESGLSYSGQWRESAKSSVPNEEIRGSMMSQK
jgi:hypothetical protein